ncbi:galactose/methyl galactoside import ATP-binding protein MglA [Anaerotignum neopropionicum]|uniref:Galactose/methyl galactoside import ATP-binding protein MglA n=1 Tax=Anaerotignum neopropionicum TaxID=36847 RepID=A0A136WIU1_9FIRM|nr:ABC transporter ATP-binding protein [Anaerotignum neopropionicum]KXL54462.1 galactose/methyl galactoside import ATP-binding protein MglA [Anaerotignum neopropionicum]
MEPVIAIEMKNISKAFGSVKANENVNLTVFNGEIHALLGENGAGKSTLMSMLSGIYTPDSGSISILGKEVEFSSPKDSIALGIGMIHQHFKLVDVMTAKENMVMGSKGIALRGKQLTKEMQAICDRYGLDIKPDKKVYEMSVGEKQTLEIIKVLYRGAKILILDEPTAVLTPQEIKRLFAILRNMKEQGCAIVIITHKLNEVMEISDRITVLRRGQSIETVETRDVEVSRLIEMMVGKKVDLALEKPHCCQDTPLLKVDGLYVSTKENKHALEDINFDLFPGEILGVAGVAGSGQKEICETIAGLLPAEKGRIFFENANILGKTPRDIIRLGIRMGFIPEDRLGMGLVGSMDMVHNMILRDYPNQPGFFLRRKESTKKAERLVEQLEILTPNVHHPIKKLSGGNIQKVLLGREIDSNPKVLITAYPARGLDIGASYKIYDLLNEQKKRGVGVLFIGEDLDVLMALCDRIMVFCGGKMTGIVNPEEITKEDIGLLMAGGSLEKGVQS